MKKNAQAWKQFYSGDVSGKGAPRNQELRFFLTTFLAYLLPLRGNGIAAAKHFPMGAFNFFAGAVLSLRAAAITRAPRPPRETLKIMTRCKCRRIDIELCIYVCIYSVFRPILILEYPRETQSNTLVIASFRFVHLGFNKIYKRINANS